MPTDLSRRADEAELIDDPRVDAAELRAALRELLRINAWLGGYRATLGGLEALAPPPGGRVSILDVGTGGGDVARRMVEWCRRRRMTVRVTAIDVSQVSLDYARERCAAFPEIEFLRADLFDPSFTGEWDIVHASLSLHHFPGDEATRALRRMQGLCRSGVIVNDGHRHRLAHAGIRALVALLSRSRLIRHDAPLSIRRSFVRRDWDDLSRAAGLDPPEVRWRWAFRWQVVWRRE